MGRQLAGDEWVPARVQNFDRRFPASSCGWREEGREGREEGRGGLLVGFGGLAVQSQVFFFESSGGCLLISALTPLVPPALFLLSSFIANGFTTFWSCSKVSSYTWSCSCVFVVDVWSSSRNSANTSAMSRLSCLLLPALF